MQLLRLSDPNDPMNALEDSLLTSVVSTLQRHYPGYQWGAKIKGGVITIINATIPSGYGFQIPVADLTEKVIVMAGGEALERYRLKAAGLDIDRLLAQPRDFRGHIRPDLG